MKASEVQEGDVIVIGHKASRTMTVSSVRPVDIEWNERGQVVAKANSAYTITGLLEDNWTLRSVTLQADDEVNV